MMIFFMVWSPGWWHQNFKSAKLFPARSAIVTAPEGLIRGRLHKETTMARRCLGETLRPCAEA
ncbi:MAG: hypothetical protein ACJ8FQ_10630 [Rhizobium sp.]